MGTKHLVAFAALAALAAMTTAALGCRAAPPPALGDASPSRVSLAGAPSARGAHVQIVRAMPTAERVALVERFKARNGAGWAITLGAGGAPDDVDAIRGLVRRGKREGDAGPSTGADADPESAMAEGVGFLTRNADFFGMSPRDVAALDVTVQPARTGTYGRWVVHGVGRIPMRGYEGFVAVGSTIDVLVYVGDSGGAQYFVNLSRVHPRLVLDTSAALGPDDKRLLRFVVGREVFVVVDDPQRPEARVRELRRRSLGRVEAPDVRGVRLTIHVSPAARGAYVSYWLAYAIHVRRDGHDFRFVVDADTGNLLEDAVVPVVPSSPLDHD